MARATSSLPVPDSPVTSTVTSDERILCTSSTRLRHRRARMDEAGHEARARERVGRLRRRRPSVRARVARTRPCPARRLRSSGSKRRPAGQSRQRARRDEERGGRRARRRERIESRVDARGVALARLFVRRRGRAAAATDAHLLRIVAVRDDDLDVAVLARLRDEYARVARLLMDDRRQLAQQQLARGDGLGQTQRQQLRGRGRLLALLLGRVALQLGDRLFGAREVELRAQLARRCVRRGRDARARARAARWRRRRAPEGGARAPCGSGRRASRDGEAAAEVVYGERRVRAREREQALHALQLARDGEVAGARLGLLRDAREQGRALVGLTAEQARLGEQRARVADAAVVADCLGQLQHARAHVERLFGQTQTYVAARQRPHGLRQIPLLAAACAGLDRPLQMLARLRQVAAQHPQLAERVEDDRGRARVLVQLHDEFERALQSRLRAIPVAGHHEVDAEVVVGVDGVVFVLGALVVGDGLLQRADALVRALEPPVSSRRVGVNPPEHEGRWALADELDGLLEVLERLLPLPLVRIGHAQSRSSTRPARASRPRGGSVRAPWCCGRARWSTR